MLNRYELATLALLLMAPATSGAQGIREVRYTDRGSIQITSQQRFGTVIVLPKEEPIVEALCADKEYWIVDGVKNAPNAVSVKPARAGAASNLHLVGASGRIYTFALREGSTKSDDKVFVVPDEGLLENTPRRYYSEEEVAALRTQLAETEASAGRVKAEALQAAETFRSLYPSQMRFNYLFGKVPAEFGVRAIWHDGRFTYLDIDARELPALYEERDGKANVPDYQVQGGRLYIVPHVVQRGYLMVGSKKWAFQLSDDRGLSQ